MTQARTHLGVLTSGGLTSATEFILAGTSAAGGSLSRVPDNDFKIYFILQY